MTINMFDFRHKAVWGAYAASADFRGKVTWGIRAAAVSLFAASALLLATDALAAPHQGRRFAKLDRSLEARAVAADKRHKSTVIVRLKPGTDVPLALRQYSRFGRLNGINSQVLDLTDDQLQGLANLSDAVEIHPDRPVHGLDFRTNVTTGSLFVNNNIGYTGAGVTIAVLDSGITKSNDDLPKAKDIYFLDFTSNQLGVYDDYGHGSHVAGIISGKGTDSGGMMAGVAPGARLVILKVLDGNGTGTVSNVIAALDWLAANGPALGVRVVNLSFGARPTDQPEDDPLALATKALVDRGIVVVAAAGNSGSDNGRKIWGGIPSPADAPWVITVGASSTMGTLTRKDDKMASFSSRGPAVGHIAKPDLVAPGVGTVSTIGNEGKLYSSESKFLVPATCPVGVPCPTTLFTPYMAMSGTSMAAPVVTGTVALMLEANPGLTPNLVKAILQYTAELHSGYNALEQGAGFLNTLGAVKLAAFYATGQPIAKAPVSPAWSQHLFWGNHRLTGGIMQPGANAWKAGMPWGKLKASAADDNIVWGTAFADDNIVWGTAADDGDNIVWGTMFGDDNIVWGTDCGGADCGDNIVWGTSDDDNIVWGTDDGLDNIVWGTAFDDNIVWGTSDSDNLVWGTAFSDDNIVWGTDDGDDNIVWGTAAGDDNIVWGTAAGDNIVWGTGFTLPVLKVTLPAQPGYGWFKKPANSGNWVLSEFGDASFLVAQITKGRARQARARAVRVGKR